MASIYCLANGLSVILCLQLRASTLRQNRRSVGARHCRHLSVTLPTSGRWHFPLISAVFLNAVRVRRIIVQAFSGAGKTQLVLQLSLLVQLPFDQGDLNGLACSPPPAVYQLSA